MMWPCILLSTNNINNFAMNFDEYCFVSHSILPKALNTPDTNSIPSPTQRMILVSMLYQDLSVPLHCKNSNFNSSGVDREIAWYCMTTDFIPSHVATHCFRTLWYCANNFPSLFVICIRIHNLLPIIQNLLMCKNKEFFAYLDCCFYFIVDVHIGLPEYCTKYKRWTWAWNILLLHQCLFTGYWY